MATDQISFYDESLKKQIEGSYKTDGKEIPQPARSSARIAVFQARSFAPRHNAGPARRYCGG